MLFIYCKWYQWLSKIEIIFFNIGDFVRSFIIQYKSQISEDHQLFETKIPDIYQSLLHPQIKISPDAVLHQILQYCQTFFWRGQNEISDGLTRNRLPISFQS